MKCARKSIATKQKLTDQDMNVTTAETSAMCYCFTNSFVAIYNWCHNISSK